MSSSVRFCTTGFIIARPRAMAHAVLEVVQLTERIDRRAAGDRRHRTDAAQVVAVADRALHGLAVAAASSRAPRPS